MVPLRSTKEGWLIRNMDGLSRALGWPYSSKIFRGVLSREMASTVKPMADRSTHPSLQINQSSERFSLKATTRRQEPSVTYLLIFSAETMSKSTPMQWLGNSWTCQSIRIVFPRTKMTKLSSSMRQVRWHRRETSKMRVSWMILCLMILRWNLAIRRSSFRVKGMMSHFRIATCPLRNIMH